MNEYHIKLVNSLFQFSNTKLRVKSNVTDF